MTCDKAANKPSTEDNKAKHVMSSVMKTVSITLLIVTSHSALCKRKDGHLEARLAQLE